MQLKGDPENWLQELIEKDTKKVSKVPISVSLLPKDRIDPEVTLGWSCILIMVTISWSAICGMCYLVYQIVK